MTAIATSTSQAVAEWIRIFPKQMTENYTSSVTLMKQLTVVAVSLLSYLKNSFPEDSYTSENFAGIKLRILKKKCRDEFAQFLSTALTQAFEAFDKKYLHQLALCFYENDCKVENLIEYHIFEYTYNDTGVIMNLHSKNRDKALRTSTYTFENVRERTILLIRTCVVIMESCQNQLPASYDVSLRLYYNEDAPPDYQAPGYLPTEEEDHLEPTMAQTVKLGCVETPFHRLSARTYIKEHVGASHEAEPSQNAPTLNEMDISDKQALDSEPQVLCSCSKNDATGPLLTCQYCNTRQHAACYGFAGGAVVRAHCCVRCSDLDPTRTPTDMKLAGFNDKRRECLCIFRRSLDWCSQHDSVDSVRLAQQFSMSESNATRLMRLLNSYGIIRQEQESLLNTPQIIVTDTLKSLISKYFNINDDNLVDRLMTESFASQESLPDPVGEVLSPLERVSLHSSLPRDIDNRVIDNPGSAPSEDPTLQQYREAILSTEEPNAPVEKRTSKRKVTETKNSSRRGVRTKKARANFN